MDKKLSNLKPFKSGFDKRRNYEGAPVGGGTKKSKLKKLLNDCIKIHNSKVSDKLKHLVYEIYQIALSDYSVNEASDTLNHLYFIESSFGIKIGISKNVENRLGQIKLYCPDAKVIKVIKFGANFEAILHKRFRHINIKGNLVIGTEWFTKHDDLLSLIEQTDSVIDLAKKYGNVSKFNMNQLNLFE